MTPSSLLCDVLPTVNRPHYPAAVEWSEDNLLAVATANTVVILNPAHLSGPRSFVEFLKQEVPLHGSSGDVLCFLCPPPSSLPASSYTRSIHSWATHSLHRSLDFSPYT